MECMVRLVRLGVGGNFFHTLGQFSFLHGFAKTTSFASSMHWSGSSALYQCSPSYEISEILKNIFATFFHQLPIPFFVLPNIRFHFEPNRFAVFIEASNDNLHRHRGGRVLVSVPTIPFFREQFLKYARLIFARVHARDSFKRRSVHQPLEAAVDDDIANRNLVFALAPFDARFV